MSYFLDRFAIRAYLLLAVQLIAHTQYRCVPFSVRTFRSREESLSTNIFHWCILLLLLMPFMCPIVSFHSFVLSSVAFICIMIRFFFCSPICLYAFFPPALALAFAFCNDVSQLLMIFSTFVQLISVISRFFHRRRRRCSPALCVFRLQFCLASSHIHAYVILMHQRRMFV